MNQIHHLIEQLQDTDKAVSEFENAESPGEMAEVRAINLQAVTKRRADLERRLNAELRTSHADLVQYHVNRTLVDRYPAVAIGRAIVGFQELVTSVFDAIRTNPKQRYRPSPENIELSTLNLAMAVPSGSVLVSMSVENERLLAVKSDLDQTFERVFQILQTRESEQLRELATQLGIASISKAHDWAVNSAQFGLNTKIEVAKDLAQPLEFSISNSEALALQYLIEERSDQQSEAQQVLGELVGIDVERPNTYFHIKAADGRELQGKLADTFPRDREWAVRVTYLAQVLQVTTMKYATGEEKTEWLLADLVSDFAG